MTARNRCKPYPSVDLCAIADEWTVDYWRLRFILDGYERVRAGRPNKARTVLTLPAQPLMAGRSVSGLSRTTGMPRTTFIRWNRTGSIPYAAAQRVCDSLRIHPTEVWGRQWHAATALVTEGVIK